MEQGTTATTLLLALYYKFLMQRSNESDQLMKCHAKKSKVKYGLRGVFLYAVKQFTIRLT